MSSSSEIDLNTVVPLSLMEIDMVDNQLTLTEIGDEGIRQSRSPTNSDPSLPLKTCSIDGCERKHMAKNLCQHHYNLKRREVKKIKENRKCSCGCGELVNVNNDYIFNHNRQDIDINDLKNHYNSGKSLYSISKIYGVSAKMISYRLKKAGMKLRERTPEKPNYVLRGGYVYILQPNHPNADKGGYVREHTLVISREIGRALDEDDVVHHINYNKLDNCPENLWLCNRNTHMVAHTSTYALVEDLMRMDLIYFDRKKGEYKLRRK